LKLEVSITPVLCLRRGGARSNGPSKTIRRPTAAISASRITTAVSSPPTMSTGSPAGVAAKQDLGRELVDVRWVRNQLEKDHGVGVQALVFEAEALSFGVLAV
jgi:hypothetical protein